FSMIPVLLSHIDLRLEKMSTSRLRLLLKLLLYPSPCRIGTFVGQIHLNQLIDRTQIVRRKLSRFFKTLPSFGRLLLLTQNYAQQKVGSKILRSHFNFVAEELGGVIQPA